MKNTLMILSALLLALSCDKMADYEAKDGETLTGILDGKEGPVSESPFVYKP